ncbi:MAG: glycosyl transferase [Hyphomicrobiales bacterium]|nr:glycosyl transferase [Hyphomicrobiales bacterium]
MRQTARGAFETGGRTILAGRTVLQIIPRLDAGGAERTTIDIAAALAEAGARPLVACEGGRLVSELQAKGGVWIPFPAGTKNPFLMALNVRRLSDIVRRERVDILHARSRAPAWVALGAARRTQTPFVTTYHGAYSGRAKLKLLYNSVMARGDVVIANSAYTAGLISSAYDFAHDRTAVIYRGADLRHFARSAVDTARVQKMRKSWKVAPEERVVLLAARLTAWKGQKVLIEAARLLVARGLTDVKFILAGDDQGRTAYVRELDAAIEKAGLKGIVSRVGHVTDMPAALAAAAVLAVTSTEPEAFGRSAVEAQAMGTPVVVTDLGAVPETVLAPPRVSRDHRTGWTIPPNDPQALADTLETILSMGAAARDALAERSRKHVEQSFGLERMCGRTLEIYGRLLEHTGQPPA